MWAVDIGMHSPNAAVPCHNGPGQTGMDPSRYCNAFHMGKRCTVSSLVTEYVAYGMVVTYRNREYHMSYGSIP